MTGLTAAIPPQAASRPARLRWQSVTEFLVVGGATVLLVPFSWLFQRQAGLDWSVYLVSWGAFYAAYAINDPHFAVTYFLFYKNIRARVFGDEFKALQRARYIAAAFVIPAGLLLWAAYSLLAGSAQSLGLMIQLMYLSVGWHYVKQGFGVLTVLSARRGTYFAPLERRLILAHCFAGWMFGWSSATRPGAQMQEDGVTYLTLGAPEVFVLLSKWAFFASAIALIWILTRKVFRERKPLPLVPLSGLLISIWLWTVYTQFDPLIAYAIPALHSLQYLYFVWLLKKNETRATLRLSNSRKKTYARLALFGASVLGLGWLLFHGAPSSFDASLSDGISPALGVTPFLAAFGAFVNLHHYFMDHVIWRRDNPDTRFLKE